MPPFRNAITIIAVAAILLAGYSLFLRWTGLRANLAESNLQANLIRISNYLHEPSTPIALAGSSIAGRLLPEYFEQGGLPLQNLGLDGSRALFAFEIVRMRSQMPSVLLVDTSALFQPLMSNDDTLREAVLSPSFVAASWFPLLRPTYRPSSLLYSEVKRYRDSRGGGIRQPGMSEHRPKIPENLTPQPKWHPEDQYIPVRNALMEFRKNGVEVALLSIPRGSGWGLPSDGLERSLANDLDLDLIEPGISLASSGAELFFSDGLHLDVGSANLVTAEIVQRIKSKTICK